MKEMLTFSKTDSIKMIMLNTSKLLRNAGKLQIDAWINYPWVTALFLWIELAERQFI